MPKSPFHRNVRRVAVGSSKRFQIDLFLWVRSLILKRVLTLVCGLPIKLKTRLLVINPFALLAPAIVPAQYQHLPLVSLGVYRGERVGSIYL